MTTIAVDGKGNIAWDSRVTVHDGVWRMRIQKVKVVDGVIYACAGNIGRFNDLIKWIQEGAEEHSAPPGKWELLVIKGTRIKYYDWDVKYGTSVPAPIAIGSGASYAIAAMMAKASAGEAVRIAAELDTATGRPIRCRAIKDMLKKGK